MVMCLLGFLTAHGSQKLNNPRTTTCDDTNPTPNANPPKNNRNKADPCDGNKKQNEQIKIKDEQNQFAMLKPSFYHQTLHLKLEMKACLKSRYVSPPGTSRGCWVGLNTVRANLASSGSKYLPGGHGSHLCNLEVNTQATEAALNEALWSQSSSYVLKHSRCHA
eukprot:4439497-Amphidinium_carterae.1